MECMHLFLYLSDVCVVENQVKGLDEDESKFLEFVENRQQEISKERNKEEKQILAEMKISFGHELTLCKKKASCHKKFCL